MISSLLFLRHGGRFYEFLPNGHPASADARLLLSLVHHKTMAAIDADFIF
jgi:hypothetical protein